MNVTQSGSLSVFLITISLLTSACSADKLEARLQTDPQCKSVMNPKTGVLMPCPGTEKVFYQSIPALNGVANQPTQIPRAEINTASAKGGGPKTTSAPSECKPQLHNKSGSLMPCP